MFGHEEEGCSVKTKCAICSGGHKTTDLNWPVRESYLNLRENIQQKIIVN